MEKDWSLEVQRQAQRGQGVQSPPHSQAGPRVLKSWLRDKGKGKAGCSTCPGGTITLAGTHLAFPFESLGREELRAAKGLFLEPLEGKGPTGLSVFKWPWLFPTEVSH